MTMPSRIRFLMAGLAALAAVVLPLHAAGQGAGHGPDRHLSRHVPGHDRHHGHAAADEGAAERALCAVACAVDLPVRPEVGLPQDVAVALTAAAATVASPIEPTILDPPPRR